MEKDITETHLKRLYTLALVVFEKFANELQHYSTISHDDRLLSTTCGEAMCDFLCLLRQSYKESPTGILCNQLISNSPVMDFACYASESILYTESCNFIIPGKEYNDSFSIQDYKDLYKESFDKEIATLKIENVPKESIIQNVSDIFASYKLDLIDVSNKERDFYRKVHRYYSSLEYYAAICFKDQKNDREGRINDRNEIAASFVERVKRIYADRIKVTVDEGAEEVEEVEKDKKAKRAKRAKRAKTDSEPESLLPKETTNMFKLLKYIIGRKAESDVSLDSDLNKQDLEDVQYMTGGTLSRRLTDYRLVDIQTDRIEQLMQSESYRGIDQSLNECTMEQHMAYFNDIFNDNDY